MSVTVTGVSKSAFQIRAYRDAALSTSGAGTWTHVSVDTPSPLESAAGYSLTGGRVVADVTGRATISGRVTYTAKLLLTNVRVRLVVEPVGGGADIVYLDPPAIVAVSAGTDSVAFAYDPTLAVGDKVRIDFASFGVGGVVLVTGDLNTWIKVSGS